MSAVEDRLPAVADEAAAPSNDAACAEALAALEAELAAQDEQFQLLASTMKLTAESLDELYAEAEKEGDVDVRRIVETVERVEKDFTRSADAAKGARRASTRSWTRPSERSRLQKSSRCRCRPSRRGRPREQPLRSVSSLSDDAVVASEPNAEPEEESFELTFPAGPLGLGVSVMRDRKSGKAHVIVDSVLESCPHSKTLEKMDEITSIAGAALLPAQPGDDPKLHLDAALDLLRRAPRPLNLGFHRYVGRYQQADLSTPAPPRDLPCLPALPPITSRSEGARVSGRVDGVALCAPHRSALGLRRLEREAVHLGDLVLQDALDDLCCFTMFRPTKRGDST